MKNEKLKIGIKEIKGIKMTAQEKEYIFKSVINSSISHEEIIKSPWTFYSFSSFIYKNRLIYYGSIFSLTIILSGGAVFASENSLPGNIFYPLKVSVVEPINSAFIFSPKIKAQYESNLATKRLVEAETLKSQGRLDKVKEEKLNLLLKDHTDAFNKVIDDINKKKIEDLEIGIKLEDSDYDDDDIVTNFQAGLNAHARVLELINEQDDESEKQEKNNKISETARANADKIRDSLKERENKNEESNEERKKHIKEMIDSTVKEINNNIITESSFTEQIIIDNTHKTLKEASQYLKEADEEDEKGDSKEAYYRLLDSESSAREASIFLRSGLKLKEYKNEKRNKDIEREEYEEDDNDEDED